MARINWQQTGALTMSRKAVLGGRWRHSPLALGVDGCQRATPAAPPLAVRVVRVQVRAGRGRCGGLGRKQRAAGELAETARADVRAGVQVEPAPQKPEPQGFHLADGAGAQAALHAQSRNGRFSHERLRAWPRSAAEPAETNALDHDSAGGGAKLPSWHGCNASASLRQPVVGETTTDAAAWGQLARRAINESAPHLGQRLRCSAARDPAPDGGS